MQMLHEGKEISLTGTPLLYYVYSDGAPSTPFYPFERAYICIARSLALEQKVKCQTHSHLHIQIT